MGGHRRAVVAALLAALTLTLGQLHESVPSARAATCPTVPVQHLAYPDQPAEAPGDPTIVGRTSVGPLPGPLAIDASGTLGRVYAGQTGGNILTVIDGRGADATALTTRTVTVGRAPQGIAVDPTNGEVFVASTLDCTISIVRGRQATPVVRATVPLDGTPSGLAYDAPSRRLFVSFPDAGVVVALERTPDGGLREIGRITAGIRPNGLAIDPGTGRLWISSGGTAGPFDAGDGSVTTLDGRATPLPASGTAIGASIPIGIAIDPGSHIAYVVENGEDRVLALRIAADGHIETVFQGPVDPAVNAARTVNPVDIALLPERRQAVVTIYGAGTPAVPDDYAHLELFAIRPDGGLDFVRTIAGVRHTAAVVLDPVTGRVFTSEREDGDLVVLDLEDAQPPPLAYVLPGPLDISLAPVDVARSVGLTALLMLLLGLPSTLFNSTLEANLAEIRRRTGIDGLLRRLGGPAVDGERPGAARRVGRAARRAFDVARASWVGLAVYLLLIAVLHASMNPAFPGPNATILLASGVAAIGVTTAISLALAEWYLRRRLAARGRPRVILWTLPLAIGSVVLARLSGAQPAYLYGVVGGYAGRGGLDVADEGRMTLRGSLGLLALAIGAWILRVPVQPDGALPQSGAAALLDTLLVGVFVAAVEAVVIGLIPLQFLPGHRLRRWSTWRWAVTWAASIGLFAHVILYPVSDAEPDPSPNGLVAFGLTAGAYAAVAVVFWAYFRRVTIRRARATARLSADDHPGL